jgi:hypothetical protein
MNTYTYGSGADPGSITTTFVRPPVSVSPLPSPNPTVSAQDVATTSIITNVTSGATYDGQPNLTQFSTTEVDTGTVGVLNLVTTATLSYYAYTPDAKTKSDTDVTAVGSTANIQAGTPDQTTITTTYGAGNGLVDVVPEPSVTGQHVQIGTPNNAALTTTEKDADGQLTTLAVNGNGTYTESVKYPDGTSASATELQTGSSPTGFYSFPLDGDPGGQNTTVAVSSVASGQIPITVVYGKGVAGPGPVQVHTSVPNWYPSNPVVLANETYFNDGPTALPNPFPSPNPVTLGACALGNDINGHLLKQLQGKPYSNKLVQTDTKVDAIFGEVETTTTSSWITIGLGLTCAETIDVLTQYYDYSGQSYYTPFFSPTPVQITTTEVQLGIVSATINDQKYKFGGGAGNGEARGQQAPGQQSNGLSGASQQRSGMQSQMRGGMQSQTRGGMQQSAQSGPTPRQLMYTLVQEMRHRLDRERVKRHALRWRQLKALHFKGIL